MDKLAQFGKDMEIHLGHSGTNPKEAVWKTPEVERLLRGQIDGATADITLAIKETHDSLKQMMEEFEKMHKSTNEEKS